MGVNRPQPDEDVTLFRGAPIMHSLPAPRLAAMIRNGEVLGDHDCAHVASMAPQRRASPAIVTRHRALRSGSARAGYPLEREAADREFAQPSRRSFAKDPFLLAPRSPAGLGGIEIDEAPSRAMRAGIVS